MYAHTHTPRQNKDDSTFEQGSNKTAIVIKNKNAVSGCHGNQRSRTPGNIVKHATEHKAAKQVKRLFIRLQHVVQCPLVRARETHKQVPAEVEDASTGAPCICREPPAWRLHQLEGTGTWHRSVQKVNGCVQDYGEVMPGPQDHPQHPAALISLQ